VESGYQNTTSCSTLICYSLPVRVQVRYRPKNGPWKVFSGKTKQEALAKKHAYVSSLESLVPKPKGSLQDFAEGVWFPSIAHLAPLSRRKYSGAYATMIGPLLGQKQLAEIRTVDCQQAINALTKTHAPATVRFAKTLLSTIFNLAESQDVITKNPARLVKVPKKAKKRERQLPPEAALEVLKRADGTPLSAQIYLALMLGMRRGEVCGLKWSDINQSTRMIHVRRQVQNLKYDGGVTETPLKSDAGERSFIVPESFLGEINRRGNHDSPYVCGKGPSPENPEALYKRFANARESLGLPPDWTFHDLRRCAASLLRMAGVDPLGVSKVLGHATIDMSVFYQTTQENEAEKAFKDLESRLVMPTGEKT